VLHALGANHRGRGLARHLWSAVCADLARQGAEELSSSISVSNLAALNLYASLGFRFRNPVDVYHKVIP
jgi:ribosomal protein S18 acetylase RimI-like enzyme